MAQEPIPQQNAQQPPIRLVGGPQTGVAEDFRIDNTQGEFAKGWNAVAAAEASAAAAAEANAARARKDYAGEAAHLRSMQELQTAAQANAPRVSSLGQINGFGDAVDYGKQLAGSVIPGTVNPVLGGTAGGILGAALGKKFKLGAGARALFGTGGALGAMYPSMSDTAIQQHVVAGDQQSPEDIIKQSRIQALRQLAPFALGGGAVQQLGNRVAGNVAQGVRQGGFGTSLAKSAFEEGALSAASAKIGQLEQDRWNHARDKSGDMMELADSFAGDALGGAMFEGPGYAAQALHQTRRDAQSAIGALAQEGVRVAPGLIDKGIAKVKNSLGVAEEVVNTGVDNAVGAADRAWANAPKSVAEAAGLASGVSRNAIDEFLRDDSSDFAKQPAFADLFTPLRGDVDAKNILTQTAAKNKSAEAFANYTLEMGDNAPPYVKAAAEEYLAGPKNYDTWHTSGLADAANVWEQSRKRNDQLASIYSSLGGAGAKALAEFQNGRDEARSEGPFTSTPKGVEKRYNEIFSTLTGVSDPANQHVDAKWILDVEQAVGRYKADKTITGDDEKIAWFRTHPYVFDELPANKNIAGMAKTLYDNHGPLPREEMLKSVDSFGDLQRSMDKLKHLRKTQNPDIQLSLGDTFVPKNTAVNASLVDLPTRDRFEVYGGQKPQVDAQGFARADTSHAPILTGNAARSDAVQGNQQRPQMSLGDTPRDTTTPPNPFEATTPNGLRNNAVSDEATLSHRLLQLEQHNNDIFRQAYARAKKVSPQAVSALLQKFGLKAPPVKGELPDNQRLDTYTDSTGREVRHQTNLGVNRAPMSEKDWVTISGGKLRQSEVGGRGAITSHTGEGHNLANLLHSKSANAKDAAYKASTIPSDKNVLEFLSNNGLAGGSPEANANNAYNKRLYAQQRETFGSPSEKKKTREIEATIGLTEAANQRAYQQQKAVVENMRAKLKDNNALFDDPMLTEEQLRTHPTLREAEYKLEDLAKQLVVKDAKPISDARFDELMGIPLKDNNIDAAERERLMGKFPNLTEAETAELTAHAPYLIDSLRLKKKLTPRDEAQLGVAYELITHAAREKQRSDKLKPQATNGVKYKRFEQAWAGIPDATKDDPFNKALTTSLAPLYPHQHIGAQQHDLPGHALGLRLWVGNGLDTQRPRKGDNGKLYVNPTGHIQGLDIMASVWGSASKARDALQTTYDMMVKEGLIPEDIRQATKARIDRSKLILATQHYANRELGNLVLQNLKPSELAKIGGGLEGAKAIANQIIRAVNAQGDTDKVFDSAVLKSQFEKLFGERAEQTRQAFWLAYRGREQRATDELFKQAGEGVGGETGRVDSVVGEDIDGNTTMRDMDNAFGKEGDARTSDDAAWVRGDDTAEFNSTDGDGDVVDSDLANMTNAMAPTTIKPPKATFHHQTAEKKVKYDQMNGGSNRRRFHDVYDHGQKKRVSSILESPGFDEARLRSLKEQDDLNNMAVPYIKGYEKTFESGSVIRHEERLEKAIADIKSRGVSDAKAVGYIDYLKEQFGVPDSYDVANPPDSARRFDAAVAQIVKRFSQDSDSPETKLAIATLKKLDSDPVWLEKQRVKKVDAELVLAEISARRELTDTEKANVVARVNRQFKDFMKAGQDRQIEGIRRKNEPNYDKLLSAGLNPYTKEALDEINSKLFVIKEEAKNESFNGTNGMRIDSSEFASVSHTSSSNKWGVAPGEDGQRSHAAVGGIWLRRASDGKVFMTTADKIVQRARNAMFAAGETQNVKGAKATHDLFLQGLSMLFEPEDATADTKSLVVTKDSAGKLGVERKGESTNIDAAGEGYNTKAGVLPEIGIFTRPLGKLQMNDELKLSPIDALSIPDSLKIGGTTWGELRKNARERNVTEDRTFLRDQQKEFDKRIAELDVKMEREGELTEAEDFEYGNLLQNRDVAKRALRFEELNSTVKKLEAKTKTQKLSEKDEALYESATQELTELHDKAQARTKAVQGIEKRLAAQQKIVSDMRNGLKKVDKSSWGEGVPEELVAELHNQYEAHMMRGGNRATSLPALGVDILRDHPEGIKLQQLQADYDSKYNGSPDETTSLADAVTYLSKWKDDQQAVYAKDDDAIRTVNDRWDAEYKSIRPFKGETKEAAIARNERRKFNNQKSILGLVERYHEDTIEHEGGTGVTYTFKPEGMVKALGGGWRALNEGRAAKGKPPIDKVTYLQSEMDLVRSLINEPEDAPLWDKYSPHYALPKTDVKKGKWNGVKEQAIHVMTELRNAHEVSNMTQQALREAKANYDQVLADAKTPGSAISEVHVKAFSKNLIDARERFQAALDNIRDKQKGVDDLEREHQHLVEDYNEQVKNRADEIHRLKSGLRSLVGYVDGLVNKTQKANQYPMRTEEGASVLDKDGKQAYGTGVRGFSDTAKDVAHKIVDKTGGEVPPAKALNDGYIFQRGQFFRIEDDEGNVVPFKEAKKREVSEKAVFNAISVSEKEALRDGFSYLKSTEDITDENDKKSVQQSRTSGVGRRIDLAATAEDTEMYKRIAKESDRERTYQEETGAALGAYEAKEYVTSSLDKRTLDIARNLARTNPDFNPAHAKGGWTKEMVDAWNGEKDKMATEHEQNVTYKKAIFWLEEKGVPAAVATLRKHSPESQAHYLALFDKMSAGGKEVWGDNLPTDKQRGKFQAAANALRGIEEKRGALEKQTVMWGKGADAGKVVAVLGKDGVYRNSMGHEVLVTDSNTQVGVSEKTTPVATKSVASKATLSMNYADGTDGMRMRPEFAGKSTMDLIASGDRTATTRSSIGAFKGVKNGDVFTVTNSAGITIKVRATSDPYPVSKVTPENWSKLEGWSPAVYNKYSDGFQMTYEKVLENVAWKAAASASIDTSNITRKTLRDNPDKFFIFGDNEARKGLGGQAQQMRGEPNAIGVATKRLPSRGEDAYWSDAEFERNKQILDADFKPAFEAKAAGKEVVVPKNGIGGGLSELGSRAPRTLEYINQQLSLLRENVADKSTPELTDSFAGIGTREINAVGAKAINDIVSAKFSTAEPSQKKDTVATLIGQDAGVKETMHAVKELIQNPLGAENAVEKFDDAKEYIKGKLKELSAAIKSDASDQSLLNRQAQFSRAFAAVEAAELRFRENQYVRAEGYPAMPTGQRGVFTKNLKAVEHSLVDSGENPERLAKVRKMLDMAQKKSKRIAPTEELTSVATSPKRLDLMLGAANAAHVFSPPSEEVVKAMRDSVERRFGDRIRAVFEEGDTVTHADIKLGVEKWGADGGKQKVSGLWSSAESLIKVALATQHPAQTLDHESFHAFYSGMVEGGVLTEGARQILVKAANSEYVRKRLDALFPENKGQHADTGFGKEKNSEGVTNAESERMANMFALWRAGELTLAPAPRNVFAKIWGKLRRVIGILREEDKADVILKAFDAGHLKTNEAVHELYTALNARERMITEVNRWTRPIAVVAQRLLFTAEVNLDKAGTMYSPEYKKIRRLFKRAVGEGGENGYLDAKDQMLKKFSNLVAAPFRDLEPEDMPRLANALAGGYENPTTAIGKAREALIGENGLIRQIDKYMADAGVQYLVGVDENTGREVWKTVAPMPAGSMPKSFRVNDVMSKGDEFIADLWAHNHKEMTEMFNSTRAKFNLAVDQVKTPDQELVDFNRAVLQRVINTFGQLHIPELTTDVGMSPIMQALNSRSISWVHPEVYKKWGENDVMKTFTSYASQAVKLTESVRRFGNGNVELHAMLQKGEWDGLRKEIQHSFHVDIGETPPKKEVGKKKLSMFDAAKQSIYEEKSLNAGEKAHLEKIFKRIQDVAKKAGTDIAGMQGLLGYDINPTLRKMQNSMLVYQNMRSLATSLLSQFIDPLNLVVRGATMGEAWDAYKRGLREVVASVKGEEIRDLDLTIAEHVGTVDAHGFLGAYGQLYSSEYMGNWFRKANDFLFRYNGMEGFNRGMQVAATRSAINFIKRHTEKPGKNSASYLAEIGLRAEKVKIDERGELDYNDPRIQRAIYQWVSGAVMRPNASQRPAYASDPHYMVFWHMKQFAYTFHDTVMKRAIHDYKKYGDTGPLGVMATCFAPVMIAADVAKSVLLTGDAPGWWNAGLPEIIEHGVSRAGLSGQYQPIVDIATTPGRSWLGLGGPMIEQLQQLGDQTVGQAAVSALPGQNVIKQVFGIGGGVEVLNTTED